MRALIDTCVVVDALQSREPFCRDAQALFLLCANQRFEGCLTAKALTDLYYLTHRQTHSDAATREVLTSSAPCSRCSTPPPWTRATPSAPPWQTTRTP